MTKTMTKTLRNLTLAAVTSTAIAGMALTPVLANTDSGKTDQVVEASKSGAGYPSLKLSQDGYNVLRDIRAARVAIFNGDPHAAKRYVKKANHDLTRARKDETVAKGKGGKENGNWIPIDGQLVISDNIVATPEKTTHFKIGNKKIKEGKTEEAIKDLKLAEVDVGFTRVLLPLNETTKQLHTATHLIGKQNYYEANMALKAAEDGLNMETVMLVEAPKAEQKTSDPKTSDQKSTDQKISSRKTSKQRISAPKSTEQKISSGQKSTDTKMD